MIRYLTIFMTIMIPILCPGQEKQWDYIFKGQLSGYGSYTTSMTQSTFPTNFRYLPELNFNFYHGSTRLGFDLGPQASIMTKGLKNHESRLDPYRTVIRLDSPRDQFRLGLQKINFGPGQVLRLLQWFDEVDIKDPLSLSPGVWAAMYRRFMTARLDLRIWVVHDQETPLRKLYNPLFPDTKSKPLDLGGRMEILTGSGTIGISMHALDPLELTDTFQEMRSALDGRWDMGIGFWFESILSRTTLPGSKVITAEAVMAGSDYTLGIGNGLYTSVEVALWFTDATGNHEHIASALSFTANYPVGLNDAISFYITALDRKGETMQLAPFAGWRHTIGNWMIFVSVFDYPSSFSFDDAIPGGRGVQVFLAYDH